MEFRKLKEGDFKYEIAKDGTCRNIKSKHIMSIDWSGGYGRYTFTLKGQKHKFLVHRLVMSAWGQVPEKYTNIGLTESELQINHKDGDKTNNHISNLEYVTAKENVFHREKVLQHTNMSDEWNDQKYSKKQIICVENGMIFESSYAAAYWLVNEHGVKGSISNIAGCVRQCCRGESKTSRGFHWKFYNS